LLCVRLMHLLSGKGVRQMSKRRLEIARLGVLRRKRPLHS